MTSAEEKFTQLYKEMAELCKSEGWGDPFSYARGKEIMASIDLGHEVAITYAGADAFLPDGTEVEYKSTTDKKCKGSYTGISNQTTWQEQVRYLKEAKIAKYQWHYYNRFDGGKLVESWKIPGDRVLEILLPKMRRSFEKRHARKDPRLSCGITYGEIKKYGTRVI